MSAERILYSDVNHIPLLYLSSLDSSRFGPVRMCGIDKLLLFESGKQAALATIEPGISGQDFGQTEDITKVILTTRFEGVSIAPVDEFPCFVFVAIPRDSTHTPSSPITQGELEVMGWGELYRTAEDARLHRFG